MKSNSRLEYMIWLIKTTINSYERMEMTHEECWSRISGFVNIENQENSEETDKEQ